MKSVTKFLAVCAAGLMLAQESHAALIDAPVPSNAYITIGGLDWAWANPLPAADGLDLSYQSQFGWRIPTLAELGLAPDATDFLVSGGNVPFQGIDPISGASFSATNGAYDSAQSAGAVATPYFSTIFSHADWQDGNGQPFAPWAGLPGAFDFADQLVVRGTPGGSVPDGGSSLLMLGAAAACVGAMRRKTVA